MWMFIQMLIFYAFRQIDGQIHRQLDRQIDRSQFYRWLAKISEIPMFRASPQQGTADLRGFELRETGRAK